MIFQWKVFGTSWRNKTKNIFSRNENYVFLQDQCLKLTLKKIKTYIVFHKLTIVTLLPT